MMRTSIFFSAACLVTIAHAVDLTTEPPNGEPVDYTHKDFDTVFKRFGGKNGGASVNNASALAKKPTVKREKAAAKIKEPEDAAAKKQAEFKENQRKVYEEYDDMGMYSDCLEDEESWRNPGP